MKKKSIRLLTIVTLCMALSGCKHGPKTESQQEGTENESETLIREGIYALPGDYKVDYPKDLAAYFDSLCHVGAFVATHSCDNQDSLAVWDAIKALDRFAKHESKFFPEEQIRKAINTIKFELAYLDGHNGSDEPHGGEAFFFRLVEQAALHCNQIDYITDFRADDRKAGVLYFESWSSVNPLYSFLVFKSGDGFRVKMIGSIGDAKIEKIFHLKDEQGREYYLCSNNNDGVYFRQYLYGWKDDDLCLIREMDVEFGYPENYEKGYELVFNPNQCTWSYCTKDGDVYHRADGTPMLRMVLDGDNSKFVVE